VGVYAYQVNGEDSVDPIHFYFDIKKLRLKENTFKITLKEGKISSRTGCTRAS
jgi:hypothetical protein